MPIATCPRCNRMFEKRGAPVCPKCEPDEYADYEQVRELLAHTPHLNADEIAREADLDRGVILRMIEQGLIQNMSINEEVRCGRCGAPAISISKRLCQACLEKLNAEVALQQSRIKMPAKKGPRIGEAGKHVHGAFESKRRTP